MRSEQQPPAAPLVGAAGGRASGVDLDGFVAARWPALVGAAMALGAPPALAEEVATEAVSGLARRWRRRGPDADPDLLVQELLVRAWDDVRRTPWWREHPSAPGPPGQPPLDALEPRGRAAAVLGASWSPPGATSPPGALALARARHTRRRRGLRRAVPRVAAGAAGLALVAGLAALVGVLGRPASPDPTVLPPVASVAAPASDEGARWLTWWAGGELHLGGSVLQVPELRRVVVAGEGAAAYVDGSGRVVRVTTTGERRLLGRTTAPASLVASDSGATLAWSDPAGAVVAASAAGAPDSRVLPTAADARVVALTDTEVWLDTDDGAVRRPLGEGRGAGRGVDPRALVAVRAGTVAVDGGDRVDLVAVAGSAIQGRSLDGRDVVLAPDGELAATLTGTGTPHVWVTRTGEELPTGVPDGWQVLSAVAGSGGRFAYVVTRAADRPVTGEYLRSSDTGTVAVLVCRAEPVSGTVPGCRSLSASSGTHGTPVLAP